MEFMVRDVTGGLRISVLLRFPFLAEDDLPNDVGLLYFWFGLIKPSSSCLGRFIVSILALFRPLAGDGVDEP